MESKIKSIIGVAGGEWGIYAKYLDSDEEIFSLNPDNKFYAASVNKLAIAVSVIHLMKQEQASLTDTLMMKKSQKIAGVLSHLHNGLELTVEDCLFMMLAQSDGTASKMLAQRFGVAKINKFLKALELQTTKLGTAGRSKLDYGDTTPKEAATLMSGLYREKFARNDVASKILDIMKNCHLNWGIERYLPDVEVSNKEGTLDDKRHEVAIIWTDRPYVLCIFSHNLVDFRIHVDNAGVLAIAEISKIIYEETNG